MTDVIVGNKSFWISRIPSSAMINSTSSSGIIIKSSFGASSSFISIAMSIFVGGGSGGGGCDGSADVDADAGVSFGAFDRGSGDFSGDDIDADDVVGLSVDLAVVFFLPFEVLALLSAFFSDRRSSSSSLNRLCIVYLKTRVKFISLFNGVGRKKFINTYFHEKCTYRSMISSIRLL